MRELVTKHVCRGRTWQRKPAEAEGRCWLLRWSLCFSIRPTVGVEGATSQLAFRPHSSAGACPRSTKAFACPYHAFVCAVLAPSLSFALPLLPLLLSHAIVFSMTAPRLLATTRAMMGTPHPQHRRRTLSAPSAFHDEARPLGIPPVLQMTSVARPPIASTSSMPFVAPMTKADSSSSTESSPEWANVSLPPHDAFQAPATVPVRPLLLSTPRQKADQTLAARLGSRRRAPSPDLRPSRHPLRLTQPRRPRRPSTKPHPRRSRPSERRQRTPSPPDKWRVGQEGGADAVEGSGDELDPSTEGCTTVGRGGAEPSDRCLTCLTPVRPSP